MPMHGKVKRWYLFSKDDQITPEVVEEMVDREAADD